MPAIPADLLAMLNRDAVQLLFSKWSDRDFDDPEEWWSLCLPNLVNDLIRQLAAATGDQLFSRQQMDIARQGEDKARAAACDERLRHLNTEEEWRQELSSCERENDELGQKLALSSAKVEVLSEVLSRKKA